MRLHTNYEMTAMTTATTSQIRRSFHCISALILLLASSVPLTSAQEDLPRHPPKREIRAVWLTTASGLDWPTSTDTAQQKESLRAIVRDLKAANFNTILFQVRPRGDAYYRSSHEPWADNLTGTAGKDPGYDPLALLIEEAHRSCMEVHAWINTFKVRNGTFASISPLHPTRKLSQWIVTYQGEDWMDPGYPGTRRYTLGVILDLVDHYDLDGINLDYTRYPGGDFRDETSYRQYGHGMVREEWRAKNINEFVASVYDSVKARKPWVKVGSSPLGVPGTSLDPHSAPTLKKYAQDAPLWLRDGIQDYVSPQIYWVIGGTRTEPDFVAVARKWKTYSDGSPVVAGIAAYRPEVAREMTAQIDTSRALGLAGQSFFRYDHISSPIAESGRYSTPALVPPLPSASGAPISPAVIAATEVRPGVFVLEWSMAERSSPVRSFVLYRFPTEEMNFDDPQRIAAIVPGRQMTWTDSITAPTSITQRYAITSVDRLNNESESPTVTTALLAHGLALRDQAQRLAPAGFSLEGHLIAYRLQEDGPVRLEIINKTKENTERVLASYVNGEQKKGSYIVEIEESPAPGTIVRFTGGGRTLEQTLPAGKTD